MSKYHARLCEIEQILTGYHQQCAEKSITLFPPVRPGERELKSINPSGAKTYNGIWVDDFYASIRAGNLFTLEELTRLAQFLTDSVVGLRHFPDMVQYDGMPWFGFGGDKMHTGIHMSMAQLACWTRIIDLFEKRGVALPRKKAWLGVFRRSLADLEFSCGLLYSNPNIPHITFGFHDTIAVTGFELMSSVYTFHALTLACDLFSSLASAEEVEDWREKAQGIRDNLYRLYDFDRGIFFAGSHDGRQADIYGSGLAAGLCGRSVREAVAQFFIRHREDLFWKGMTRGCENGEGWQLMLLDGYEKGEYQNGAYWPCGTAYVLPVLYEFDPDFAIQLLEELTVSLPKYHFAECVSANDHSEKCPDYMMSVSFNLLAVRAMKQGTQLINVL